MIVETFGKGVLFQSGPVACRVVVFIVLFVGNGVVPFGTCALFLVLYGAGVEGVRVASFAQGVPHKNHSCIVLYIDDERGRIISPTG